MASKLAQQFAQQVTVREGQFGGKARKFYHEICRCLPFIHKAMRLEEIVSVADMRAVVNSKFKNFKNVSNEKVVDMLIFKGREELEVYLTLHKQRHHVVTEYLEPVLQSKREALLPKKTADKSAFLESFLDSNYTRPTGK
jgi:NADH dehydrogenase (ubiquinone) 1 alpha subcomplex subunit 6